jgi:TFIIF-interacting CTD phosphatase-like protein
LTATSSIFNIYVYTAGRKNYADAVIDAIDPKGLIKKRFYRDVNYIFI